LEPVAKQTTIYVAKEKEIIGLGFVIENKRKKLKQITDL